MHTDHEQDAPDADAVKHASNLQLDIASFPRSAALSQQVLGPSGQVKLQGRTRP